MTKKSIQLRLPMPSVVVPGNAGFPIGLAAEGFVPDIEKTVRV